MPPSFAELVHGANRLSVRRLLAWPLPAAVAELARLPIRRGSNWRKGSKIVLIGNALAERMQYFGHWETLLHSRFPQLELVVRNLGWTGDELTVRLRSKDFQNHGHRLEDHKPDVVIAAFGFNESFAGAAGLPKFKSDLDNFIRETITTHYNGKSPPQLVLLSPIAHENLHRRSLPDGQQEQRKHQAVRRRHGRGGRRSTTWCSSICSGPACELMESSDQPLTINGIHLERLRRPADRRRARRGAVRPTARPTRSIWKSCGPRSTRRTCNTSTTIGRSTAITFTAIGRTPSAR